MIGFPDDQNGADDYEPNRKEVIDEPDNLHLMRDIAIREEVGVNHRRDANGNADYQAWKNAWQHEKLA